MRVSTLCVAARAPYGTVLIKVDVYVCLCVCVCVCVCGRVRVRERSHVHVRVRVCISVRVCENAQPTACGMWHVVVRMHCVLDGV